MVLPHALYSFPVLFSRSFPTLLVTHCPNCSSLLLLLSSQTPRLSSSARSAQRGCSIKIKHFSSRVPYVFPYTSLFSYFSVAVVPPLIPFRSSLCNACRRALILMGSIPFERLPLYLIYGSGVVGVPSHGAPTTTKRGPSLLSPTYRKFKTGIIEITVWDEWTSGSGLIYTLTRRN